MTAVNSLKFLPGVDLPPEWVYAGTIKDAAINAHGRLVLKVSIVAEGKDYLVNREYEKPILKFGSVLHVDIERFRNSQLTLEELRGKFDIATLIGSTAPVVVTHRRGSGGKTYAEVTMILPRNFQYPTGG